MDATYIQESIEQLKTNIFMHVRHRTLLRYTGEPVLNENQLFYLLLPFLNGEKWDNEIEKSAITVGIVHASLTEHDKIDEKNATSKEQQLIVLSGDYYSGRYYEILAQLGNIPLIKQLSEGIANRCEHQIRVYEVNSYTLDEWYETTSVIQTELIKRFYQVYGFEQYSTLLHTGLLLLKLQDDVRNLKSGYNSLIIEKMIESTSKEVSIFEQKLLQKMDELKNLLNEYLDTSTLRDEIKLYIKQLVAF